MVQKFSANECQEYGKRLFKAGEYEKALLQFTSAIDGNEDVTLALVDHRAATLEKLSRLDDALKDGTAMIKLDKRDVRGYLRTGRILQKFQDPNKRELALKVYAKGLRNVPVSHEHYKALQATHDSLTRGLASAKAADPFVTLPVELVEMIFSYLAFHQMVRCIGVCRTWKRFVTDRPSLWHHIDLSGARRPPRNDSISRYINRGRGQIRSFTFHRHSHPGSLIALLKTNKSLETLRLLSTEYGTQTIVSTFQMSAKKLGKQDCDWLQALHLSEHTIVTLDGVTQIMRHCSGLVKAYFDGIDAGSQGTPHHATWSGDWPLLQELRLQVSNEAPVYITHRERWQLVCCHFSEPVEPSFH